MAWVAFKMYKKNHNPFEYEKRLTMAHATKVQLRWDEKGKKTKIWLWISALVNSDQSGLVGTEQKNSSAAWSPMSFYIGINRLLSRLYRETFVGLLLLCQPQGLKCRGLKVASDMEGSTYCQHQLKKTKKGKVRLPINKYFTGIQFWGVLNVWLCASGARLGYWFLFICFTSTIWFLVKKFFKHIAKIW